MNYGLKLKEARERLAEAKRLTNSEQDTYLALDVKLRTEEAKKAYNDAVEIEGRLTEEVTMFEGADERAKKEAAAAALAGAGVNQGPNKDEENAIRSMNLLDGIARLKDGNNIDGALKELTQEGTKEMREFGGSAGSIVIPSRFLESRATIDQATSLIQPTVVASYVEALREAAVYTKVGVTELNGLTADYKIPIVGAQSLAWATAENSAAADGGAQFTSKTLQPTRLTGYVDISNKVLMQNGLIAQTQVMMDMGRATANMEDAALWSTANVTNAPGSVPATSGVGTFTETAVFADAVSVMKDLVLAEMELANQEGLGGKLAYIAATNLLSQIKRGALVSGVTRVMEGNIANGYPIHFTTSATKNGTVTGDFLFGDFSNVYKGNFGGLSITVDKSAVLLNDETRIVLHKYTSWKLAQGGKMVKATSKVS